MRSTKEKFLAKVDALAEKHGLEMIHDSRYSNCGVIYIQSETDLTPLLSVSWENYNYKRVSVQKQGISHEEWRKEMRHKANDTFRWPTQLNEALAHIDARIKEAKAEAKAAVTA